MLRNTLHMAATSAPNSLNRRAPTGPSLLRALSTGPLMVHCARSLSEPEAQWTPEVFSMTWTRASNLFC